MERELLTLWILGRQDSPTLGEGGLSAFPEESECEDLLSFVRNAAEELRRRKVDEARITGALSRKIRAHRIRVTRELRVFIDESELRVRPMAKTVFILFLQHPEGITLKDIWDYRDELSRIYSRISRSDDKTVIEQRISTLLDICNNALNISISRANQAVSAIVDDTLRDRYTIRGRAGAPKTISLPQDYVDWE